MLYIARRPSSNPPPNRRPSRCWQARGPGAASWGLVPTRSPQGGGKKGAVFMGGKDSASPAGPLPFRKHTRLALGNQRGGRQGSPGGGHGSTRGTRVLSQLLVGSCGDQLGTRPTRGISGAPLTPLPLRSCPDPCPHCGLRGGRGCERLPAEGQQAHDDDGRAELLHALLDDNAIDGPARVVGEESLSCRETGAQGASAAGEPGPFLRSPGGPPPTPHQQTPPLGTAGPGRGPIHTPHFSEKRDTGSRGASICTECVGIIAVTGHGATGPWGHGARAAFHCEVGHCHPTLQLRKMKLNS